MKKRQKFEALARKCCVSKETDQELSVSSDVSSDTTSSASRISNVENLNTSLSINECKSSESDSRN